jgi:hypothetical protein
MIKPTEGENAVPADVLELRPGPGHNQPPEPIDDRLDPAALKERLEHYHAPLMRRFAELEQGAERAPATIETEDEATRLLSFITGQCRVATDDAKKAHDAEKRAYLECGRVVDRFFLDRIRKFTLAINGVEARAETFLRRKREAQRRAEEEQRRRAEEERRRAEAEAARLAAAAKAEQDRQAAAELGRRAEAEAERASAAAKIVTAPAAPVRLHGDYGAVGYMQTRMVYEVADPNLIPRRLMKPDDEAIRAEIARGVRDIPGLEIFEEEKLRTRRC